MPTATDSSEEEKGEAMAVKVDVTGQRTLKALLSITTLSLVGVGYGYRTTAVPSARPSADHTQWTLVWSDEFDGANGSAPDPTKWTYDVGGNGWGNKELEYYTTRTENAHLQDGQLVIRALKEDYKGPDGVRRDYTSARLKTQGLFEQTYGRFEARIKIPYGQGLWPAYWMLGSNIATGDWPNCGEIDIFENIGREPLTVHGTVHGPGYSNERGITGSFTLPSGRRFADGFHLFAVEWEPETIRFYVDSSLYQTIARSNLPPGAAWVFDHPFFLLLNVAVGGKWPGSPDVSTIFPQTMLVDYVRVYKQELNH
jgi:beta-glucanase (GH16 family)